MEFAAHHHQGEFAVFIGFAGLEGLGVDHGDGGFEASFEALHIAQVSGGGDGDFAAEFFRIGGDCAQRYQTGGFCLLKSGEEEIGEQEVAEIVGGDRNFIALGGAHGGFEAGEIDGGIEDEGIERAAGLVEGGGEAAHAFEIGEIEVEEGVACCGDAGFGGGGFGLGKIAAGHDDVPSARCQRLGGPEADAG